LKAGGAVGIPTLAWPGSFSAAQEYLHEPTNKLRYYRDGERVTRNRLRDIAQQFQNWVKNRCQRWNAPVLDAPTGRRDDFVDPYFKHAKKDEVVLILKAREPARIMIAIGAEDRWHLQLAQRWIVQYNFYINDHHWGRMFVRICPYLPFSRFDHSILCYRKRLRVAVNSNTSPS